MTELRAKMSRDYYSGIIPVTDEVTLKYEYAHFTKSDTGFAITICSSPLLKYWSPWLFSRQHCGHQWCSISISNYPWKKRPSIGFTTTGEQIPIEIHYRSLPQLVALNMLNLSLDMNDNKSLINWQSDSKGGNLHVLAGSAFITQNLCHLVLEQFLTINQQSKRKRGSSDELF